MKKFIVVVCLLLSFERIFCQNDLKVYPTHWWVGMKDPRLQLLIHSLNIGNGYRVVMTQHPGVRLVKTHRFENSNYLAIDLEISNLAKPDKLFFKFMSVDMQIAQLTYELKSRSTENGKTRVQGVTSEDLVYLIMPDRFANGDPSNDFFPDMRDTQHDRKNPFDRHGGDLQGVADHLDYLKELGITGIWMTPVVENDMARTQEGGVSRSTYHGYAFTDQYNVDRRFGGNEVYKKLVNQAHAKGLKIIQDAVYNHVGNDHWFIKDLPMKDWVNQWPRYTNTSYKDQPVVDPYAAQIDKKISIDGWFTPFMPDMNQRNPYVSAFLIQYAIWATEEFGIDGWRVDTYFYSDSLFLNKINNALLKEFPKITVFGEAWVNSVINSAYFAQNNFNISFKHNLQGVTDFPLLFGMIDGLNQPFGWIQGVNRVYAILAQDLAYKNPNRNCIFLDNHDLDRIYSVVGEDYNKFKMGINWLLTLRGVPQLYYGTEILMKNFKNPSDAEVRKDFPGGWKEDEVNKFIASGRTPQENEAFNYISGLAGFRKNSSAIKNGKLMQYVPQEGVYVYFRYDDKQTIMIISNTGSQEVKMDWSRFDQRMKNFSALKDVISGEKKELSNFTIQPKESFVFELLK